MVDHISVLFYRSKLAEASRVHGYDLCFRVCSHSFRMCKHAVILFRLQEQYRRNNSICGEKFASQSQSVHFVGARKVQGSCNYFLIKMMLLNAQFILLICLSLLSVRIGAGENKYSAEANKAKYADSSQLPTSLRDLDKPFRMAKLNVLWVKAKNVSNGLYIKHNFKKYMYIYIFFLIH